MSIEIKTVYITSLEIVGFWCGQSLICQWRFMIEKSRLSTEFWDSPRYRKKDKKEELIKTD